MRRVAQHLDVLPRELVGAEDGLAVPVGPEEGVVQDGEGEDVLDLVGALEHVVPVLAVEVAVGDVVEVGVGVPQPVREEVDGEGVGPGDVVCG